MSDFFDDNMIELINQAKQGDNVARNMLVEKNVGLVWSIVKRFNNRGYEMDDLFQIGCIGLMKSISKFDSSYEVKFSTYAVPMIIGEIKRFIRDDGIIKVSRSLKEISNRAKVTKEIMSMELGREPSVHEIANKMSITPEDLVMAMEASMLPESLYQAIGEGDNSSILLIDRIACDHNHSEAELIDKITLKQILEGLEPRERQIIILRYFKEKTQMQIASMLGISQVQVSRVEKRILKDIRKRISQS